VITVLAPSTTPDRRDYYGNGYDIEKLQKFSEKTFKKAQ
jgi:hypothetical protein